MRYFKPEPLHKSFDHIVDAQVPKPAGTMLYIKQLSVHSKSNHN